MSEAKNYERGEITRRGNQLFEEQVRAKLPSGAEPRAFVAIDIETGDFEVDERERVAIERLEAREPAARGRIFLRRVGSKNAYHFSGRFRVEDGPQAQ